LFFFIPPKFIFVYFVAFTKVLDIRKAIFCTFVYVYTYVHTRCMYMHFAIYTLLNFDYYLYILLELFDNVLIVVDADAGDALFEVFGVLIMLHVEPLLDPDPNPDPDPALVCCWH